MYISYSFYLSVSTYFTQKVLYSVRLSPVEHTRRLFTHQTLPIRGLVCIYTSKVGLLWHFSNFGHMLALYGMEESKPELLWLPLPLRHVALVAMKTIVIRNVSLITNDAVYIMARNILFQQH